MSGIRVSFSDVLEQGLLTPICPLKKTIRKVKKRSFPPLLQRSRDGVFTIIYVKNFMGKYIIFSGMALAYTVCAPICPKDDA